MEFQGQLFHLSTLSPEFGSPNNPLQSVTSSVLIPPPQDNPLLNSNLNLNTFNNHIFNVPSYNHNSNNNPISSNSLVNDMEGPLTPFYNNNHTLNLNLPLLPESSSNAAAAAGSSIPFGEFLNFDNLFTRIDSFDQLQYAHKGGSYQIIWDFSQKTAIHEYNSVSAVPAASGSSLQLPQITDHKGGPSQSQDHPSSCIITENDEKKVQDNNNNNNKHKRVKVQKDSSKNTDNIIKGQWTQEEDRALVELVEQHGHEQNKWAEIAKSMNGRIGKQCRERWHNHLRPNIRKDPWSLEEDKVLIKSHQEIGNKWAEIAKRIPGRTENTIKNHWNATKRRSLRNGRKNTVDNIGNNNNEKSSLLYAYIKKVNETEKEAKVEKNISNMKKKIRVMFGASSDDVARCFLKKANGEGTSTGPVAQINNAGNNNVVDH